MVVQVIRDFKAEGEDAVTQAQVVNKLVHLLEVQEGAGTSLERA